MDSGTSAELVQSAPIALGGPTGSSLPSGRRGFQYSTKRSLLEFFGGRLGRNVVESLSCQGSRHALVEEATNDDPGGAGLSLDGDDVVLAHPPCGLDLLVAEQHLASVAGFGGGRAGLVQTHGPEPLIDAKTFSQDRAPTPSPLPRCQLRS